MKAYIIKSENKLEPFLERVEKSLIKNKELGFLQRQILDNLKIGMVEIGDISEINDNDEYIVFGDNIYFEPELLEEFIRKSRESNCNTVCSLKSGIFTSRTIINIQKVKKYNDRIEYNLYYYPKEKFRGDIKPVILDPDTYFESITLPKHMHKAGKYMIPLTVNSIAHIDHWSNLWSVNLAAILSELSRLKKMNKFKLLFNVLKSFSLNRWKIASNLNKLGENCDIHPTAYIEGSIIGDNVIVGAGAIIRSSVVGDDCFIGNDVCLEYSNIGENSTILNGHILYSVLYPGVFSVTHMISASIIGRDCFIGSGAVLTDFRFDGRGVVLVDGNKKIDSGNLFLGCCLGNNVYLGSGCIVAPGRSIPNNLRISLDKDRVISNIYNSNELSQYRIIQ